MYPEKNIIKMDASFKLYILSSKGPEVNLVNIYKDDKDENRYVKLENNTDVSLDLLEVVHLRDHVCSIKRIGDSDKNNLKLWKLTGVKSKDIKEQNISIEEDIVKKLHGEEMELEEPFSKYFQNELNNKNKSGSSVITIVPSSTEQPVAAKRTRENSIISTEGPLHPHEDALMLPVCTRDIFREVISGIYGGKSYIIHGPYQSGKTTFLLELKETIRGQSSNLKYFSMPEIKGETLTNKREGFFKFISYRIFREVLTETETIDKISELEIPYYVLIDEFQYIFTDEELLNVTKDFFRNISSSKVRYVAVGTFILVDLLKDDGELISPFNKASFKLMDLFDSREMGEIFKQYQLNLNVAGVPSSLTAEIIRESCGHPASFMILLKLYHDFRPTVNQWRIILQGNLAEHMNGTHIKMKHIINHMHSDEKKYLRGLTEYMEDHWDMDLSDLTALDDTDKKLLNFGILNIMDKNSVGFTSCIILRICIETLFPKPSRRLSKDEVPDDPIDLLSLGLGSIDPTVVTDKRARNKAGMSERVMQASLFSVFNGLLPKPMMCLLEMKGEGRTQLDLMIVDGKQNKVAYSLKSSLADFEKPIKQALCYANHYEMEVQLVNFFLKGHNSPSVPDDVPEGIVLINVKHNSACTEFTITLPLDLDYYRKVSVNS